MVNTIAHINLGNDIILHIRIFVNRRKILSNNTITTIFETPLLSNNSIIMLNSPNTRIYISTTDIDDLCNEIKDALISIVYELTSPILQREMSKIRVGNEMEYAELLKKASVKKARSGITDVNETHILSVSRISKNKYKLYFKYHWEVDIFIENMQLLSKIRSFLLFKDNVPIHLTSLRDQRGGRVMLMEKSTATVTVPAEESAQDTQLLEGADEKPELQFRYQPLVSLGPCLSVHVLQRPVRKKGLRADRLGLDG